jgi:MoxR-like ATPase
MTPTVSEAAAAEAVVPSTFDEKPELIATIAKHELKVPDFANAVDSIMAKGFFDRGTIEDAVVSVSLGHLMISGPPGTGKTLLAQLLADAFGCTATISTANPEWSVFDVIGSQLLNATGGAEPRHGVVTSAIMKCAATIVRNLDTGNDPQGGWLIIDEINRAEIDRAFGPLFTALAGNPATYQIDYLKDTPTIEIPKRFRIIATLNDFDTRFVNSMSGALRRRFARTVLGPPANDPDGRIPAGEFEEAWDQAATAAAGSFGAEPVQAVKNRFAEDRRVQFRSIFGGVRQIGERVGLPIGTAQVMDTCTYALALGVLAGVPDDADFGAWIDRVLAVRLIPTLESDSTRTRIDMEYVNALKNAFPMLERSCARLRQFLTGDV